MGASGFLPCPSPADRAGTQGLATVREPDVNDRETVAELDWRLEGDILVIALSGKVDLDNADEVRKGIRAIQKEAKEARVVVMDLSGLSYLDSAGLGTFVGLKLDMRGYDKFMVFGLKGQVLELFKNIRLHKILDVKQNWEEVLSSLDRPGKA